MASEASPPDPAPGSEPGGRSGRLARRLLPEAGAPAARPIFVTGSPRSGTTALMNYLNRHPEIVVCRERYKYLQAKEISPKLFTFERILDYRPGETNQARDNHVRLLERKDPTRVKWIGDKNPHYVKRLELLTRRNPGARFIVLYRPAGEVAESFQARASDPADAWPSKNGFEAGIEAWNTALRYTRAFVERSRGQRLLVVDYHGFFAEPESFVPLLSAFLQIDFDNRVRKSWRRIAARFESTRRFKRALTEREEALIEERKDHEAERWILDYMERQRDFDWRRRPALRERVPLPF